MKGILLISHGNLAKGLYQTTTMFVQNEPQYDYLCFDGDNPDLYEENLIKKMKELDKGDGLIVLADLFGGSPAIKAAKLVNDKVKLITGMNLPVLLQLLYNRSGELNVEEAIEIGKEGLKRWEVEQEDTKETEFF